MEHILNGLMAENGGDYYTAWIAITFSISGVIALIYVVVGLLYWGMTYINDAAFDMQKLLPNKLLEFTEDNAGYDKTCYGISLAIVVVGLSMVPFLLPLLLIPCYLYPVVPLAIVTGYAALRISRAVVRIKKKLSSHIADVNAHTKKEK